MRGEILLISTMFIQYFKVDWRDRMKGRGGFTLLETLVVIALAAVFLPGGMLLLQLAGEEMLYLTADTGLEQAQTLIGFRLIHDLIRSDKVILSGEPGSGVMEIHLREPEEDYGGDKIYWKKFSVYSSIYDVEMSMQIIKNNNNSEGDELPDYTRRESILNRVEEVTFEQLEGGGLNMVEMEIVCRGERGEELRWNHICTLPADVVIK